MSMAATAGIGEARLKRCSAILFAVSLWCAVLAVALVSLDECPWWPIPYFPARPSYLVALAGVIFWLLSGRWYREAPRHKALLACVLGALLWGAFATVCGSLERKPGHLVFDYLFFYMNWRVLPLVFLAWIGLSFSELKNERVAKLLSLALLLVFLPNLVHGTLEILANAGATDIKDFLINSNHLFRKEKVAHGWWPPVFFEGRVRGLFAEPCFMAFSLLPLVGYFSAKLRQNRLYLLPLAALVVLDVCGKTYSGLIGIGALGFFLVVLNPWLRPGTRRIVAVAVLALGLVGLAAGGRFLEVSGLGRTLAVQLRNIERISAYCTARNAGRQPTVPRLDYREDLPSSASARLTAMRLDIDAALHSPFVGTGFFQKGFYWQPLAACDFQDAEFGLWVRQAEGDPFRTLPQLSEYTTLMAEFGFPGLFFFLFLYFFILKRSLHFSKENNDYFLFCLTCSYGAMLVEALFISLINAVLFFYLSGFLYALSQPAAGDAPALSGSSSKTTIA